MPVIMRILQTFDARHEEEFMAMEKKFAELEAKRPDYPNGTRLQPISSTEPCNTLVWQCEFPDIETAYKTLDFFHGDDEHEARCRAWRDAQRQPGDVGHGCRGRGERVGFGGADDLQDAERAAQVVHL